MKRSPWQRISEDYWGFAQLALFIVVVAALCWAYHHGEQVASKDRDYYRPHQSEHLKHLRTIAE